MLFRSRGGVARIDMSDLAPRELLGNLYGWVCRGGVLMGLAFVVPDRTAGRSWAPSERPDAAWGRLHQPPVSGACEMTP